MDPTKTKTLSEEYPLCFEYGLQVNYTWGGATVMADEVERLLELFKAKSKTFKVYDDPE